MRARTRREAGSPQPPPSARPTPERQRHAAAVIPPAMDGAVRRWWTIRSRLDGLLIAGLIERDAWQAASNFRNDFEHVARAVNSPIARLGQARSGHDDRVIPGRLDAARRVRLIRARIGAAAFELVVLIVVDDISWTEVARWLGCGRRTAKRMAAEAIGRLMKENRRDGGMHQAQPFDT